ncbi:hypothetical protein [Pontibacter akesuensis]|nr:hypothetical protein [Pontibacter akesuensis]GHA60621.1 hypothetical protein GCM10007389_11120 [Pontibacter akesuensis]
MNNVLKSIYAYSCFLLLLCLGVTGSTAFAQTDRGAYTGSNSIMVALEGPLSRYEYGSQQLLVRHNKNSQQLELILPVASLLPLNDSVPPAMAYHTLFGAKYPQLLINIHMPDQTLELVRAAASVQDYTASIQLQGVNNETRIPVAINRKENTIYFSTNFDLMLDNFQGSIPVEYLPLLTGRILISIENAQWVDLQTR